MIKKIFYIYISIIGILFPIVYLLFNKDGVLEPAEKFSMIFVFIVITLICLLMGYVMSEEDKSPSLRKKILSGQMVLDVDIIKELSSIYPKVNYKNSILIVEIRSIIEKCFFSLFIVLSCLSVIYISVLLSDFSIYYGGKNEEYLSSIFKANILVGVIYFSLSKIRKRIHFHLDAKKVEIKSLFFTKSISELTHIGVETFWTIDLSSRIPIVANLYSIFLLSSQNELITITPYISEKQKLLTTVLLFRKKMGLKKIFIPTGSCYNLLTSSIEKKKFYIGDAIPLLGFYLLLAVLINMYIRII